ncbi:MAG: ribonuclease P protein component [Patescibacteria group bacterium]
MVITLKKVVSKTAKNRCVIIVGKNVEKKATGRNKIKRRLRAILRPLLARQEKGQGVRVVVKPGATAMTFRILKQEVESSFDSAK